jgi:hypothetical protein
LSWDQRFFDPIIVPRRKPLVSLRDAALYITKLPPKEEHDAEDGFCGPSPSARSKTMTDEQLAAMHRLLAEHHRNLAKEATLDVVSRRSRAAACG